MSTQSNTYVLLGVKLPYDHFDSDQLDELEDYRDSAYEGIQHHNGLCMVTDGMSGEYIFIGRVLAKSIDDHGEGIQPTNCTATGALQIEVADLLAEHFGLKGAVPMTWAFTHYR